MSLNCSGAEGEDSKEEIELNPRTSSVSSTQASQDQVDFARGPDNIEVHVMQIHYTQLHTSACDAGVACMVAGGF